MCSTHYLYLRHIVNEQQGLNRRIPGLVLLSRYLSDFILNSWIGFIHLPQFFHPVPGLFGPESLIILFCSHGLIQLGNRPFFYLLLNPEKESCSDTVCVLVMVVRL